ncbi:hypothetical protein S40285_02835 [Stachybotrys chlorohalonatus IBT 40285]|uniref:Importin N-terminal domain-containing protein n=1 Tax=Stachybotrys chlorohalonatus (strain IBT 40285) TaxID=1283841 RepID=A0A084QDB1_STAC4|nr:hypothetical protein S40285_02835 [Stachybotrys chlorohalonata IBT 40285]
MTSSLTAAKQQLRTMMKLRLSIVSQESVAAQSSQVFETLKEFKPYREARRISIYLSMPSAEIQTDSVVRHALASGKQVFVPYLHKSPVDVPGTPSRVMDMVRLSNLQDYESLKPDRWGIPSIDPATVHQRQRILGSSDASQSDPATLDMILMPGVAFDLDEAGFVRRLGHGKGFYDYFINRYSSTTASQNGSTEGPLLCALALKEQFLPADADEQVPTGPTYYATSTFENNPADTPREAIQPTASDVCGAESSSSVPAYASASTASRSLPRHRRLRLAIMASNGGQQAFAPTDVLAAMLTLRSSEQGPKAKALKYLEEFQKSKASWGTVISILQSKAEPEATLFAATTLRGKITFDLSTQLSQTELPALRDQILVLLKQYATGPRPVRVQLCVCLAVLAIQMKDWDDVLPSVVQSLSDSPEAHACILDFLRVLPEEVTEGRKIKLSEEDLIVRTQALLGDNASQVVRLLINYSQSSPAASRNPQLIECITSWLKEVPVSDIVNSPLLDIVFNGITTDECYQEASECLCTMVRETGDVEESRDVIQILYPRIVALENRIPKLIEEEDVDSLKSLTKVLATAAESWVIAISRQPAQFRPLVDAVLKCAVADKDRDVIEYTFNFWNELKQYLVLDRYIQSRLELVDVYSKLVDIMLHHLQYPQPESGSEADLFEGDREQEEKFREFRHQMGDTLKDACEVMGVTECLTKALNAIQVWMQKYASQVTDANVPHWQQLEAPLFAMRALGRMVDKDENIVLPQLVPLLVQIPNHEKLHFATIMVLGRYTEWTAAHPEYLEPQFNYIVNSFQSESKEILRAAALAMKYFCLDCKHLLSGQVLPFQSFYDQNLDKLPDVSKEEVTEGVANVVATQPNGEIYQLLKVYCDPLVQRLMDKANNASDEEGKLALADHLQLITIFVQHVAPLVSAGEDNPAVRYWQEVFPILSAVLDNFLNFTPICERICRCWRNMVISYRTAMSPLLPAMANKLAAGFETSREGCFLWVTSAILREFSDDREHVDQGTTDSIYSFFEAQTTTFLRVMTELQPKDLPDVIDDFFRLLIDALLYYPQKLIPSALLRPIVQASIYALTLEQRDPLCSTLHFLRDLLSYGGDNPASSDSLPAPTASEIKRIVKAILLDQGENLVKQVMAGMMITFPRDCFADGSGVLLALFELVPAETTGWVAGTIQLLPPGTVSQAEAERLMAKIGAKLQSDDAGGMKNVRSILQDFTNTYRRRNVAPRDGLGQLETARFQFSG